jgi:hypothetical protein
LFLFSYPFARHALRKGEIREAIVVGGGALAGLAVFGAGLLAKQDALMFFGLTLVGATFPMSLVFTNRSKAGQVVFGATGAAVYLGGFASVALLFVPQDRNWAANVFEVSMLLALLTTWI